MSLFVLTFPKENPITLAKALLHQLLVTATVLICCLCSQQTLLAQSGPQNATIVFDIRCEQLLTTETFGKLMPDGELPGMLSSFGMVPQRLFGAANLPADYAFIEAARPPQVLPFDFFANFKMKDKEQAEDMADMIGIGSSEQEFGEKKFSTVNMGLLAHQPSETTVEMGVEKYLTATGRRFFTPRLSKAFAGTPNVPIRIAMDLETQKESVEKLIDLQIKNLDAVDPSVRGVAIGLLNCFKNVTELRIGIGLQSENLVSIEAIAYDDEKATELQEALNAIIFLGKAAATPMLPMIEGQSQQLGADVKSILETASVTTTGSSVKLLLPTPANFDKTLASVINLGPMGGGPAAEAQILPAEYDATPVPEIEEAGILPKEELRKKFEQACFPGTFWGPSMAVEVDALDIPNNDFYEFKYRVMSVKTKDGSLELHRPKPTNAVGKADSTTVEPENLWFNGLGGGNIKLPVSLDEVKPDPIKDGENVNTRDIKKLKQQKIGSAELEIIATSPKRLTRFELTTASPRQEKDGVRATLQSIKGSRAEISYRGGDLEAYGFDETGKRLRRASSFGTTGFKGVSFRGVPTKVVVIIQSEKETVTFPATVDLNGGQSIRLPREPSSDIRTRPSNREKKDFESMTQDQIDALEVKQEITELYGVPRQLFYVDLPTLNGNVDYTWNNTFFGEKAPVVIDRRPYLNAGRITIAIDPPQAETSPSPSPQTATNRGQGSLPDIRRAFGNIEFKAATAIEQLDFKKQADGQEIKMSSSLGQDFIVTIDKHQVSLPDSQDIIQTQYYDASGRRLRADHPHSRRDGRATVSCWGIPTRVELSVRGEMLSRTWDYDLAIGETDETAYQSFKSMSKKVLEIGTQLAELASPARRAAYNHTVGGMHFVFKKGTETPLELVSKEIALSDPKGAEQFQYEVEPYQGYHFVLVDNRMQSGKETPFINDRTRKEKVNWSGGEFEGYGRIHSYNAPFMAWPADPKDPVVFCNAQRIYYKFVDSGKEETIPDRETLKKDWTEGPSIPQP